jgi:type IV fimbrial biogenesis protein FimT
MSRRRARAAGFTLIELMVTITLVAILAMLAAPSFTTWIKNSQLRTTAEALQNGLRLAQAEALRRNRQTVFSLTNSAAPENSLTAVANGRYWSINTVVLTGETTDVAAFVQSGVLTSTGVSITGPASICFSSLGRLIANATPGIDGADCTANAAVDYDLSLPDTTDTRRLRVTVALGGQVRMCDRDKTLSASHPDGCAP